MERLIHQLIEHLPLIITASICTFVGTVAGEFFNERRKRRNEAKEQRR